MSFLAKLRALDESAPVQEHVVHKGTRLDFFVKVLTAGEVESISERSVNKGKKSEPMNFRSRCIALAVCEESGKPQIPLQHALALSNGLAKKLFEKVSEHNDFGTLDEDEDGEDAVTAEEKSLPEIHDAD